MLTEFNILPALKNPTGILFLYLVLLLWEPAGAQEFTVSGSLPGAEGFEIRMVAYDDLVSKRPIELDKQTVGNSGEFNLMDSTAITREILIQCGYYDLLLFVEPGIDYRLDCDSVSLRDEYRPFYKNDVLPCWFPEQYGSDLNQKISDFNSMFDQFVTKEFGGIYQKRNLQVIRQFKAKTDSLFDSTKIEFFTLYREYKIASLELAIAPTRKPSLFRKYIDHREIHYDHPEYMHFFEQFFDHHFTNNNRFIRRFEIKDLINQPVGYAALTDSLGKDTLLRNERVRELVILINLKSLYHEPGFSQKNILDYTLYISTHSKFPEHRKIAGNIYHELTRLETGYPAPEFKLPTLNGDTLGLKDFAGKPVYIGFMNTLSFAGLAEFERMDSLYRQFGQQVQFVTLSLDPDPETITRFKKEKHYEWTFLYNGLDYGLIDAYNLKTLPAFILIDKQGNILQYPARKPSENIRASLERLLRW